MWPYYTRMRAGETLMFYLHCKRCIEEERPNNIEVYADDRGAVVVHCVNHDLEIYKTPDKTMDVSKLKCDHCGSEVPHTH